MPKLTVAETAARFRVSRQRVQQWIAEGRIAATWQEGTSGRYAGRYMVGERARRPAPKRRAVC